MRWQERQPGRTAPRFGHCCTGSSSPVARAPGRRPRHGPDRGRARGAPSAVEGRKRSVVRSARRLPPTERASLALAEKDSAGAGQGAGASGAGVSRSFAARGGPTRGSLGEPPVASAGTTAAGGAGSMVRAVGAKGVAAGPRSSADPSAPKLSSSRSSASSAGPCNPELRRAAISPAVETCVSASCTCTRWSNRRVSSLTTPRRSMRPSSASRTGSSRSSLERSRFRSLTSGVAPLFSWRRMDSTSAWTRRRSRSTAGSACSRRGSQVLALSGAGVP